jgi:hypothetical protein
MTPNRHIFLLLRDPFDVAGSYAIWWGGVFVASTIVVFREPGQAKREAQGVGLGLPGGAHRILRRQSGLGQSLAAVIDRRDCRGGAARVCRRIFWKAPNDHLQTVVGRRNDREGVRNFTSCRRRELSHRSRRRHGCGGAFFNQRA